MVFGDDVVLVLQFCGDVWKLSILPYTAFFVGVSRRTIYYLKDQILEPRELRIETCSGFEHIREGVLWSHPSLDDI